MNRQIERHRNILDFALSSLLRRKAKNLSLLVVYALIVFAVASLLFFVQAMKREAALILAGAPDLVVQRMVAGRHDPVPLAYAESIGAIRGVGEVAPRLWGYYYEPVVGANYTFVAQDNAAAPPNTVIIGSGVARSRRAAVGDLLAFRTYRNQFLILTVREVLPAESELVAADLLVLSKEDFRTLFDFPMDRATDIAVSVPNPREIPTVAAKIASLLPDTRPIMKSEMLRTYDSIFDWRGGMVLVMLSMAILSFLVFAWDKATGLSAEERREIGILKSIGWETSDVLLLKFWEGTVISLSAFQAGIVLAYVHVFFFSAPLFEHVLKGWAVLYPRFRLVPAVDGYQIAILFSLTVVPYTVATIVPCWRAATADPDAAMRS